MTTTSNPLGTLTTCTHPRCYSAEWDTKLAERGWTNTGDLGVRCPRHPAPAPANKHMQRLLDAVADARPRGWEIYARNGVRRMVEHETPGNIPAGWWSGKTFNSGEWLDFVPRQGRVPTVVYRSWAAPWVGPVDEVVSFRKALELLAAE